MLKALELAGFKSFADKTRFEFPQGITVVVGPNGSGKSNVVDAIKWALGEQSVKSLRGKEMADVIFNGSGSRRGMNSAEITLTFNNANLWPLDTPEVHITRRVYRSGEGEYLINRNPCRLREIRDLLAGTGMGTQAYSVIEQGKVDVSCSPRHATAGDLRGSGGNQPVQAEEDRGSAAAGESGSKSPAFLRHRRRSGRSAAERPVQAGKARRYKEYTDRLQELRTQVGQVDWRRLTQRLDGAGAGIAVAFRAARQAGASAEAIEAQLLEAEGHIGEISEAIRQAESRIAANRERIAAQESSIEHHRQSGRDLEQEMTRHRRQLVGLRRADDLEQELQNTRAAVQAAEDQHRQTAERLTDGERALTDVIARLDHLRGENEQRRAAHLEHMRLAAGLASETSAWRIRRPQPKPSASGAAIAWRSWTGRSTWRPSWSATSAREELARAPISRTVCWRPPASSLCSCRAACGAAGRIGQLAAASHGGGRKGRSAGGIGSPP